MNMQRHKTRASGVTLVELIVVMAVVGLMAALAIPTFATMGQFTRTDMQRSAQTLHSALRAARIYASTYRAPTAVAYTLDNYQPPSSPGTEVAVPLVDSVNGSTLRVITGFATFVQRDGNWIPMAGEDGDFRFFPGGMVVLLQRPRTLQPVYADFSPRFNPGAPHELEEVLGMQTIQAAVDGDLVSFPAHIFTSRGSLSVGNSGRQRFELLVAPPPDSSKEERMVEPEAPEVGAQTLSRENLLVIPIELYQATGKVKVIS